VANDAEGIEDEEMELGGGVGCPAFGGLFAGGRPAQAESAGKPTLIEPPKRKYPNTAP